MAFSAPTVVVSRSTECRTRLLSVRNSNDLMIRSVSVASVLGLFRLVRISEISPSPDMFTGQWIGRRKR
jgi:hypothetical protein